MIQPGRLYNLSGDSTYRFGFNGQMKDNNIYGLNNAYTALFWEYDPRLGRRWNTDPVVKSWMSTYATFGNNPIIMVDPDGNTDFYWKGNWIGTDGKDNGLVAVVNSRQVDKEIQQATKAGVNTKDYNLHNGESNGSFSVIHKDILKEAVNVLDKADQTPESKIEYKEVLKENPKGGYDKTYEGKGGQEVTDSKGNSRVSGGEMPSGDVSIHSHPLTVFLSPDNKVMSYDATSATACDAITGGDKCLFPNYKLNVIVGKNGLAPATYVNDGIDNRSENINIFGPDNQLKFSINKKDADAILGDKNEQKKQAFKQSQQQQQPAAGSSAK